MNFLDLNVKAKTNAFRVKQRQVSSLGVANVFRSQKVITIKEKINRLTFIKLGRNFLSSKDTVDFWSGQDSGNSFLSVILLSEDGWNAKAKQNSEK